ncbi:MAG: hypothetical protein ACO1NQ_00935 [Flavobacteriales bacterium]
MRRLFAASVLLVLGAVHLAPLAVLIQFHLDRAHIERELCVQRAVVAEMRTCHGECQLSKRFRVLEQKANDEFPTERIETRFEPKTPIAEEVQVVLPGAFRTCLPVLVESPLEGDVNTAEPVPWC